MESTKLDNLKSTFRKSSVTVTVNPKPEPKPELNPNSTGHTFDYNKPEYIEKGDLQPLSNPQGIFKGLVKELGQEDWTKKFQALNKLRQIIRFAPDLITAKNCQLYTKEILKGVDNLRSGISRISLMTLAEFSEQYTRMLDTDVEAIFTRLVKKSNDASAFIVDQVRAVRSFV